MCVRAMTLADAEVAARLATQLGYPTTTADIARRLEALLGDSDHGLFVAEDSRGSAVGWVHVHGRQLLECERFAEIGGLVVDEAYRGQGLGRALVAEAERWAAAHGYQEVCVRSNAVRTEAHRFYANLGYRTVKAQQVFRKPVRLG